MNANRSCWTASIPCERTRVKNFKGSLKTANPRFPDFFLPELMIFHPLVDPTARLLRARVEGLDVGRGTSYPNSMPSTRAGRRVLTLT